MRTASNRQGSSRAPIGHPDLPDGGRISYTFCRNMVSREERDAFYSADRTEDLPLAVNDSVRVLEGEKKGMSGAVISLESEPPSASYLIEFSDGSEAVLPFTVLKSLVFED